MYNPNRNFKVVTRLLGIGAIVLLFLRKNKPEPERSIYGTIALSLLIGVVILTVLYYIKPGAFKDKSQNPDGES